MYKVRELSEKDIPVINKWRQQEELYSYLGAPFRYIGLAVDEAWYENYLKNRHNTVRIVVVDKNDEPLAMGALTDIDHLNQTTMAHFMVGDPAKRGQGIGAYIGLLLLKHAFMDLNLNKVESMVVSSNKESLSVHETAGFVVEGVRRKCLYKNGELSDLIMLGLLREESDSALKKLEKFEQRARRRREKERNESKKD